MTDYLSHSTTETGAKNEAELDYVLEYLVVLADDQSFTDALESFCADFDLVVEEIQASQLFVSGDDFSIHARLFPSPLDQIARAVLVTVVTEDEYDQLNAREVIEERSGNLSFEDLILLRDSIGERRTIEAYRLLNELENTVRKVVAIRATSLSGNGWWSERIESHLKPPSKKGRNAGKFQYQIYKENEIDDDEISHRDDFEHHGIFYLDLSELKNIIAAESNWKDGFANDLKVLRNIDRLDLLNKLRRKIAHNRFLSQRNLDDLRRIHKHLIRLCFRTLNEAE